MKRSLVVALAFGLVAGSLALPAEAKKKKKKPPPPAPVATTLYLDGAETVGEVESDPFVNTNFLKLTPEEPSASTPKSRQIFNYVGGPNTACAGNTFFPVYVGDLVGTVQGELKVTFQAVATPGALVDVRVWPDVNSLLCNSSVTGAADYPDPAAEARVALPVGQGTVEAVVDGVNFTATQLVMLQITPVLTPPFFGRVFYGSTSAPSKIEFSCIPPAGATACVSS